MASRSKNKNKNTDTSSDVVLTEPLNFISVDEESGEFGINPKVAELLQKIRKPVAVISIAGLYRTGKSFILNQLAGRTDGFDVGSTIDACTKGIWIWQCTPEVTREFPRLRDTTVLLLDTEGLGSLSATSTHDVQIFSLAILLSSYFVYNSLGNIDENALDKLSLVVQMTKHIRAQSDSKVKIGDDSLSTSANLRMYFPSFLWLVRDFSLDLLTDGKKISMKQYLESALRHVEGDVKKVGQKNQIREYISSFFVDRDCYTMKRPVVDEEKLKNIGKLPKSEFRQEYLEQLEEVKDLIFRSTEPKKINNQILTGEMLVELANMYVKAINEGAVMEINTAWENVVQIQCHKAFDLAKELYLDLMNQALADKILENRELNRIHKTAYGEAQKLFKSTAVGDKMPKFNDSLTDFVDEQHFLFKEKNKNNSLEYCRKLINDTIAPVEENIKTQLYKQFDEFSNELNKAVEQYQKNAKGPGKNKVLADFYRIKAIELCRKVSSILLRMANEKNEEKVLEAVQRANQEYARLESLFGNVENQCNSLQEQNKRLANANSDIEDKCETLNQEIEQLTEKTEQAIEDRRHMEAQLKQARDEINLWKHKYEEASGDIAVDDSQMKEIVEEKSKLYDQLANKELETRELEKKVQLLSDNLEKQKNKDKCVVS